MTSATTGCGGSRSDLSGSRRRRSCFTHPAVDLGITEDERRTIVEMMAKGTYRIIVLATPDLDATFADLQSSTAEIVQEPTDQPCGIRDCAVRDPSGNLIRINEVG